MATARECELFYWRERGGEIDYVVTSGQRVETLPGMAALAARFKPQRQLLIDAGGIPVEEFLAKPVAHWFR